MPASISAARFIPCLKCERVRAHASRPPRLPEEVAVVVAAVYVGLRFTDRERGWELAIKTQMITDFIL